MSFHLDKISLLASKELKVFVKCPGKELASGPTSNSEIIGDGSIAVPHITENVSKTDCQKVHNFGHDQNMCIRVAGACLQRSHVDLS